jgi:hypothetical protein
MPSIPPSSPYIIRGLFCAGQAWSPNGDLVVAGGATYNVSSAATYPTEGGADFLYLFDPSAPSQPFPTSGNILPLYPNEVGGWKRYLPGMLESRYYPTVTLSQRLQRLTGSPEVAMVSGGSDVLSTNHDPRNTYECWQPLTVNSPNQPFAVDPAQWNGSQNVSISGPSTGGTVSLADEWFDEYPRLHLVSDPTNATSGGKIFTSGMPYLSSKVDLNTTGTSRVWDISVGRTGSSWTQDRTYGSSVFFATLGSLSDIVVRLDGAGATACTDTTEYCLASTSNAGWNSLGQDPAGARTHINAVILPDASIVVIAGNDSNSTAVFTTSVYRVGVGWTALSSSGNSPTVREYHTTALLTPDGYVFVGGGEGHGSTVDYDRFKPHYLQGNPQRPTIVTIIDPSTGLPAAQDTEGTWLLQNDQAGLTVQCDNVYDFDSISRVVFMAPGAITHHSDMSARYVELTSKLVSGTNNQRVFNTSDNAHLPRGYYMMFVLNSALVPSVASWVKIQ